MILSRVWYVLLGVAAAVAVYVLYLAVGEYNRQATHAAKEGLASDNQTVEWALKIDARRRLDALLAGSVDSTLQQALVAANGARDSKVTEKSRGDAKRALAAIHDAVAADWRPDALFAVDRDGVVVGEWGYDAVATNEDFELGGYPAVNDALHGWLRDDMWLLGSKMYVVAARPVEYDATQRPAGAIVGLKEVSAQFAQDLAARTRTNLVFYVAGRRVAAGVTASIDGEVLDRLASDAKGLGDKAYQDGPHMLGADLGVMYARLPGDVWPLGGGFAVARTASLLGGPMAFLGGADDSDKAGVSWAVLAAMVLLASAIGGGLTLFEHSVPLRELLAQSDRFKAGAVDRLHVARFRGAYRLAAQAINEGIERAIEKSGGVTKKPADLESILGPTPAQPAMSAFSFPLPGDGVQAAPAALAAATPGGAATGASMQTQPLTVPKMAAVIPAAGRPPVPPAQAPRPPSPSRPSDDHSSPGFHTPPPLPTLRGSNPGDEDESTTVAEVPAEVLAQAAGPVDEGSEWMLVYNDFIRIKRQCGEPIDGLTFDKFCQTLRKNRDVLVDRHGCKRVKFSVYVKEGRASLKATPVKD